MRARSAPAAGAALAVMLALLGTAASAHRLDEYLQAARIDPIEALRYE